MEYRGENILKRPINFSDLGLENEFRLNMNPKMELWEKVSPRKGDYSEFRKLIASEMNQKFSVVGVDIYKYSEYDPLEQILIPKLFDELYNQTCALIEQNFKYIFQNYITKDDQGKTDINLSTYFIGTGDGGYQILETPLHSILFICVFESVVRMYNSNYFMSKLFEVIGPITLRYAMTNDFVYHYNSSYYGPAIINNARILSKDKLNRLIIDENTYYWFQLNCLGIENLMNITIPQLYGKEDFLAYNRDYATEDNNELIYMTTGMPERDGLKAIDVQKMGTLRSKKTEIEVYNVYIQVHSRFSHFMFETSIEFTYSVGNQNPQGLVEEKILP